MTTSKKQNKGFVILYAVLVAGVVSMSGILLANIIVKQLVLSSIGKESQVAYYAANAGAECVAYADTLNYFGKINIDGEEVAPALDWTTLGCVDHDDVYTQYDSTLAEYRLRVKPTNNPDICADVTLRVVEGGNLITSRGTNFCTNPDHPRAVAKEIYRVSQGVDSI